MRSWPAAPRWSLAGQIVALQIAIIIVVVAAGSALALVESRRTNDAAAKQLLTGIVTALADAPSTAAALQAGTATKALQPVAESVRAQTGIAFITVMAPDGTRFTHTDPRQIGGHYLGTMEPALRGHTFTEFYTGTLGRSVRTIAPVRDGSGRVLGLVAAGITETTLTAQWLHQIPVIAAISLAALALSLGGTWLIRRRLLRQTHGLRPDELRVMYEHHDAVLHSVSEGLLVLEQGRVALANDEARRLLALPPGAAALTDLPEFLRAADPGVRDEVRVLDDRVLVVSRSPVGASASEVVTIRDRTELQSALGELSSLKVLTDSLRAQAHETANKLHTVITMVEMGRPTDAVAFATDQLELSQRLVDRLSSEVREPALVALLLGKNAQAHERGIEFTVTVDSQLPSDTSHLPLTGPELVTVLGNLIDNAMDACDRDEPWVEVTVRGEPGTELLIRVADSGPGMDPETFENAMRRGYSTKSTPGHGLGLALVAQVVKRHAGALTADASYGSAVSVTIPAVRT
ncbi:sensor histidine kinase [Mycobacterium sp. CBMA293]|uniref:sensor histidine kinase n=1 Tax=unclassified Mycolicibacterium TaxID=2636767 RepID=UPI0012DD923E|nr:MULTISPECIES: sensor histidine kinase [unclassified Mycolicibacterium]MUL45757.1 sensor histidine kinase [Mycolicibacterium sp. CBMA 360]MUL60428.1 sensor histidine kinase [Mycolicibacterium sp. CBMA 335]MUL72243.1 sensor histidine kinase [Mycolicibacterium sp. CBMA 311]MUL95356.1 sensor histidine kinase [Mycolicibacterium sp. CBMA 230]MUM06823.1 ATP-binding protein [Mycolicibacterium sp. CBMA 213]